MPSDGLFAFDSQGNLKWQKIFELQQNCQGNYPNSISALTADNGMVYFVVKGARYIQTGWCSYCADILYAIDPDSIDPSTTTVDIQEIKWKQNLGIGISNVLIGQNNLYLKTIFEGGISCFANHYLYSFNKTGQLLVSTSTSATLQLIDAVENLYGRTPSKTWVIALNQTGGEIWRYYGYPNYFVFPFALSKDGTLYAPTSDTLFAFGQ